MVLNINRTTLIMVSSPRDQPTKDHHFASTSSSSSFTFNTTSLVFVVAASDAAALKKALSDANEGGVVDLGVLAARGGGPACVVEGKLRSSA